MATDMQTRPAAKYEVFVDQQLAKVRQRIRALDAGRSLLMLGVVSLGYFLLMAAFDLWAGGADTAVITGVRLGLFGVYLLVMGYFVAQLCLRLYRRINPYYAAKQLEETIPDAKNSVINWLDLRGEELPGAIRSAVGLKAAHDLKHTDADKAVDPKSNWLLGGILAGLLLGIFILFAMGPHQFGSLLGRAFAPFRDLRMDSRAQITLLRPAEGNATISLNQRVEFQAQIEGRFPAINQPGAPRVLYRYQQSDPFVVLPLEEAIDRTWSASLARPGAQRLLVQGRGRGCRNGRIPGEGPVAAAGQSFRGDLSLSALPQARSAQGAVPQRQGDLPAHPGEPWHGRDVAGPHESPARRGERSH